MKLPGPGSPLLPLFTVRRTFRHTHTTTSLAVLLAPKPHQPLLPEPLLPPASCPRSQDDSLG